LVTVPEEKKPDVLVHFVSKPLRLSGAKVESKLLVAVPDDNGEEPVES